MEQEIKKITREDIEAIDIKTGEIESAKDFASELIRTAQDRCNTVEHDVERDGKTVKLTEKVLWDETYLMGNQCQAALILKEQHPEVFAAYKAHDEKAEEYKKMVFDLIGVDYTQMRLSDYIKLSVDIAEMVADERNIDSTK